MQLRDFYTVLCTDDVAGTAAFWEKHFGFRRAFGPNSTTSIGYPRLPRMRGPRGPVRPS